MTSNRKIELKNMVKIVKQLSKSFPREKGVKLECRFVAYYSPSGMWVISTPCFWTYFKNKAYKVLVNKMLVKYGFKGKTVIVNHKSIHVLRGEIITNENLVMYYE